MNVLLIDGHPDLSRSTANAAILAEFAKRTQWQINHLGGRDFSIIEEQEALLAADLVIVQFPLYWSAFPYVLKRWVDDVFTFGFAFGPDGCKLKDKKLLISITAGATAESYAKDDFNLMPIENYQRAFEHVFRAAQMKIVDTIITFEMNANPSEGGNKEACLQLAETHAKQVIKAVAELTH